MKRSYAAASLLFLAGCSYDQPTQPARTTPPSLERAVEKGPSTNTLPINENTKSYAVPQFAVDYISMGGRFYTAIPIPANKTAFIDSVVESRETMKPYMLVPKDRHIEDIQGDTLEVSSNDETYFLVNIQRGPDGIVANKTGTLIPSTAIFSRDQLERKVLAGKTTLTETEYVIPQEKRLLRAQFGSESLYTVPASLAIPGSLGRIFYETNQEPHVKVTREPDGEVAELTLTGYGFVPIRGTLIDMPRLTPKTPPIEEPTLKDIVPVPTIK